MIETEFRTEIVADLRRTADVIEHNGWIRGNWFEPVYGKHPKECPVCSGGGLAVAIHDDPRPAGLVTSVADTRRWSRAYAAMTEFLERDLVGWNDNLAVGGPEAIKAFRDCADMVEAGQL